MMRRLLNKLRAMAAYKLAVSSAEAVMITPDEIRAAKELAEKDDLSWLKPSSDPGYGSFANDAPKLVIALCDTALSAIAERDAAMAVVREIKIAIEAARELYSSAGPLAVSVGGLLDKIGVLLKDKSNV